MRDPCPASESGVCLQVLMGFGFGVCPEDGVCDEMPDDVRAADTATGDQTDG